MSSPFLSSKSPITNFMVSAVAGQMGMFGVFLAWGFFLLLLLCWFFGFVFKIQLELCSRSSACVQ